MNFQNDRYTLKFADESDNEGIREVYEAGSFPGDLEIRFLRNPKPYESFLADGDSRMMVILDNEAHRTVAVGGAVTREEYVAGEAKKVAYMTGLKIHPDYQKKIGFIAKSFEFLRTGLEDCAHCYTTILDDNAPAIAMLEKKRKNMPTYRYLGHYTTYCFHGGFPRLKLHVRDGSIETPMLSHFAAMSFVPVNRNLLGLGEKKFYSYEKDGVILACCYVGNTQATKQYELHRYGGIYRKLCHLPTPLLGYPAFPKEGSLIDYGVVSFLYVKDNDPKLCRRFLQSVAAKAGFRLLLWGCFENNPLQKAMEQVKTVHYGSRLYEVDWEDALEGVSDEKLLQRYGTIGVEVALL